MIGTGVFTSLGFQLLGIQSPFALLMLWVIGGIIAFCGALCYAELGTIFPRSGGEYNFLSNVYHPSVGFVSGWVSASIGFAAPTALAAITFATYLNSVIEVPVTLTASLLVILLTLIHCTNRSNSGGLQSIFTVLKILFIVGFSVVALVLSERSGTAQPLELIPTSADISLLTGSAFAVSLIYVSYAFTGWNAATYVSSELEKPQTQLPKVLLMGTVIVTFLYVLLNYVFLKVAPIEAMQGKVEIGFIAASYAFGDLGSKVMGVAMALLLISTVSAMIIAGPRVLQVMGEDFSSIKWLAVKNSSDVPARAICFQCVLTLLFIVTGTFDSILVFAGFTLGLNTLVTVFSLFVVRWRKNSNATNLFRVPGYPIPPLVYLLLTGWTLGYILLERPIEALAGLGIIVVGFLFWLVLSNKAQKPTVGLEI